MKVEDWKLFRDLLYSNSEGTLQEIADRIRAGSTDQLFLDILASHVEPDGVTPFGTRFVLKKPNAHASHKKPRVALRIFLETNRVFLNVKKAAVFSAAMEQFGVTEDTLENELKDIKKSHKKNPGKTAERKALALAIRDAGLDEFQFPKN